MPKKGYIGFVSYELNPTVVVMVLPMKISHSLNAMKLKNSQKVHLIIDKKEAFAPKN